MTLIQHYYFVLNLENYQLQDNNGINKLVTPFLGSVEMRLRHQYLKKTGGVHFLAFDLYGKPRGDFFTTKINGTLCLRHFYLCRCLLHSFTRAKS